MRIVVGYPLLLHNARDLAIDLTKRHFFRFDPLGFKRIDIVKKGLSGALWLLQLRPKMRPHQTGKPKNTSIKYLARCSGEGEHFIRFRTKRSPHMNIAEIKRFKGFRWMPWRVEAMKDVARCDKLR